MEKKRLINMLFIFFILILEIIMVNAASGIVNKTKSWHPENNITISVDGNEVNLHQVINRRFFTENHNYSVSSSALFQGHNLDEIWVSVNGNEKSLMQFLLLRYGLCGNSKTLYYTGPNNKSKPYHYATEIEITIDSSKMSLQDAIDSRTFCHPSCIPVCRNTGTFSEAWHDSCTFARIKWALCNGHTPICKEIGTSKEGWYDSVTGGIIQSANCDDSNLTIKNAPVCKNIGTFSEGWYSGAFRIKWALCAGHEAVCDKIGTSEEGWYDSVTRELIQSINCYSPDKNDSFNITFQNAPVCRNTGTFSEGWYMGALRLKWALCKGHESICKETGTSKEGWYDSVTGKLILLVDCDVPISKCKILNQNCTYSECCSGLTCTNFVCLNVTSPCNCLPGMDCNCAAPLT